MAGTELEFFIDISLIMIVGSIVILLFHKLKQSLILGYILAGILIGPYVPYLRDVSNVPMVESIAELGIIMLLFALGLSFSFSKLRNIGWIASISGTIIITTKILVGYLLGLAMGWSHIDSFFLGALISISSTAVITKGILDKNAINEKSSQIAIGILIIEDIAAVIILTVISGIAITGEVSFENIITSVLYISFFIFILLAAGFLLVPKIIEYAFKTGSREIFLITALGLCFGFAIFGYFLGLSLAIGAFVCGVVLGESGEGKTLHETVRPLKDMFSAIFFISIGILFDPAALLNYWPHIIIITVVFTALTIMLDTFVTFFFGISARTALNVGLIMCVLGEFSFIIAREGTVSGITGSYLFPVVVTASILTLIINSYTSKYSANIINSLDIHLPRSLKRYLAFITLQIQEYKHHMSTSQRISEETKNNMKKIMFDVIIIITTIFMLRLGTNYSIYFLEILGPGKEFESTFIFFIIIIALGIIITALIAIAKSLFRLIEMASLPLYIGSNVKRSRGEVIAYQVFRGLVVSTLVIISALCVMLFVVNFLPLSISFLPIIVAMILIIGYLAYNSVEKFNEKIKVVLLKGFIEKKPGGSEDEELPINVDLPITEILSIGDTIENMAVDPNSPYLGKKLKSSGIRENLGASVIGIRRKGQLLINPDPEEPIITGDVLILLKKPV